MTTTPIRRAVVAAALLVAFVGIVDALRGGEPDLATLFAVLCVALTWLLVGGPTSRRLVSARADLAAWVDERSALTGEPADRIVDRALAQLREAQRDVPVTDEEAVG